MDTKIIQEHLNPVRNAVIIEWYGDIPMVHIECKDMDKREDLTLKAQEVIRLIGSGFGN
jgi:hypothetical protein